MAEPKGDTSAQRVTPSSAFTVKVEKPAPLCRRDIPITINTDGDRHPIGVEQKWSRLLNRPQRYQNADALYAFESRGFGGEDGLH